MYKKQGFFQDDRLSRAHPKQLWEDDEETVWLHDKFETLEIETKETEQVK